MKEKIEKQKQRVEKLVNLIAENPELRILPMVDSEVVQDDCHWWAASFGDCEVENIFIDQERIWVDDERDDLVEQALTIVEGHYAYDGRKETVSADDYYLNLAKQRVDGYAWEKVITVQIRTV